MKRNYGISKEGIRRIAQEEDDLEKAEDIETLYQWIIADSAKALAKPFYKHVKNDVMLRIMEDPDTFVHDVMQLIPDYEEY